VRYGILESQLGDADIATHYCGMKRDSIPISGPKIHVLEYVARMEKLVYKPEKNILLILTGF
jgi:hypothetical protein